MSEDEYAIVSKKEFMALRKELDRLKKNPLEGSESGETLQSSIDNLNKSLNVMLEVFKQAADDMKIEEHEAETVGKQIGPINDKLETLIDQNQKIAKGIVAVADMVKEKLEEISEKTSKHTLPPLSGGPAPKPVAPAPRPAPGMGMPYGAPPMPGRAPPGLPPLGVSDDMDSLGGLPPLAPSGVPGGERKNIMGGLMR